MEQARLSHNLDWKIGFALRGFANRTKHKGAPQVSVHATFDHVAIARQDEPQREDS